LGNGGIVTIRRHWRGRRAFNKRRDIRQLLLFVLLAVMAIGPVVTPSQALDETCRTWTAELLEDEGGPVLTASICSDPQTWLFLTCHEGTVWIRYDLAAGSATEPELDSAALVTFTSGATDATLDMAYQAMDGMFAASVPADGPLVELLTVGSEMSLDVTIFDEDHFFVERMLSLEGASEALGTLLAAC
jgi:hypothetical protein